MITDVQDATTSMKLRVEVTLLNLCVLLTEFPVCRYLHGNVTVKNDVYSFGVVWLELISGRRAVISNDLDIVQWAAMYTKKNSEGLLPVMAVDPVTQV
jgi:hypothetical protein